MNFLSFFPVIEALLSFGISFVLFKKWWATGDKSTKFWAWAFLFHFMSYLIAGFFVSRIMVLQIVQYFALQFARQTFESLLFLSVYFGIINLLTTKKELTFTLPFAFFSLQEIILAYFDFFIKDLRMADQLHIVFFDIPFNILVALLFWKFYKVSKKKYSAWIAGGWLLYAVFVPMFFYTEGNVLLYTISLSHIVVMFIGFVLLYESPTGQAILEITPAVEKRLSTSMKYQLKPGKTYLIENVPESFDIFMDGVLHGIRGMIISRTKPDIIQQKYELQVTPVLWLSHVQSTFQTADPSELEQLGFLVDKFVVSAKEQALTEGEVPVQAVEEKPIEEKKVEPIIEKVEPEKLPKEEKPIEPEWKQKMRETMAEVKEGGKKPVVFGEEAVEKPLKEMLKEAEKVGVTVEIKAPPQKKGIMMVLDGDEEKSDAKVSQAPQQKQEAKPQQEQKHELSAEERLAAQKELDDAIREEDQLSKQLSEKPLSELMKEAEKRGGIEIQSKPSSGKRFMLNIGDEKEDSLIKTQQLQQKPITEQQIQITSQQKSIQTTFQQKTMSEQQSQSSQIQQQPLQQVTLKEKSAFDSIVSKIIPSVPSQKKAETKPEEKQLGQQQEQQQKQQEEQQPRRGKMLILDDEDESDKKSSNVKANFIFAAADVPTTVGGGSGGLNKSIILIDGVEYLISNNTFGSVLHLLQMMKDKISTGDSMLLIPIDPRCIDPKELALLRQEFDTYIEEKEV